MSSSFESQGVWKPEGRGFSMGRIQPDGKTVYLTGQVAWDVDSKLVGLDDVSIQTEQCFRNIDLLLKEVGGELKDIVSLTTYFLTYEDLGLIQKIRSKAFEGCIPPVSTSVRVAGLGDPGFLVELTPIAVIPFERYKE